MIAYSAPENNDADDEVEVEDTVENVENVEYVEAVLLVLLGIGGNEVEELIAKEVESAGSGFFFCVAISENEVICFENSSFPVDGAVLREEELEGDAAGIVEDIVVSNCLLSNADVFDE